MVGSIEDACVCSTPVDMTVAEESMLDVEPLLEAVFVC